MPIGPNTRLAVLIGDPVGHSLSPVIHNAAYRLQEVDAVYLAVRVASADVRDVITGLKGMGAMGVNVTIPHKQAVLSLLDDVRSDAKAIGAVNTIVVERGEGSIRLIGENTDVTGFLAPLIHLRETIRGQRAVVLGAGGAARAVLYACQTSLRVSKVTVVARNPTLAEQMVETVSDGVGDTIVSVRPFRDAESALAEAALIVNTTPVGMYPDIHESPWVRSETFRPGQIVYDLVYNPVTTRFLREAASRGAITLNGIEMLIAQAAAAHTLWTGLRMPVDDVREVVLDTFGAAP